MDVIQAMSPLLTGEIPFQGGKAMPLKSEHEKRDCCTMNPCNSLFR